MGGGWGGGVGVMTSMLQECLMNYLDVTWGVGGGVG